MKNITKARKSILFELLSKYDIIRYMDFDVYIDVEFRDCNDLDYNTAYNLGFEITYGDGDIVTFRERA